MSSDDAKTATQTLLTVCEVMAVSYVGEEGKLNLQERLMLESSLPAMLENMTIGAAERATKFMYPLVVMLGFGAWGVRIARVKADKDALKSEIERTEAHLGTDGLGAVETGLPAVDSKVAVNPYTGK